MAHWAGLLFILWAPPKKKINISTHTQFACWHFVHFVEPKHEIVIRKAVDKEKNKEPYCIYYIQVYNFNRQPQLCFRSDYDTIFVYERHWHFFKMLVNRFSLVFSISFSDRFRRSSTNSFRIYTMSSSANLCKF